jgi:ferrous iron transport protein A
MFFKSALGRLFSSPEKNYRESTTQEIFPLSFLKRGERAEVVQVTEKHLKNNNGLPAGELERRLLEIGFVEGTEVTLQHEGFIKKDPIAVLLRVCSLVAIRRYEAQAILVRKLN